MKMTAISKNEFEELSRWVQVSKKDIPSTIFPLLVKILAVYSSLISGMSRAKQTLHALRQAMGILPKSEKGSQLLLIEEENANHEIDPEKAKEIDAVKQKRSEAWSQKIGYDRELKKLLPIIKNPLQMEFDLGSPNEMIFSYPVSGRSESEKGLKVNRMEEFERERSLNVNFDYPRRVDLQVLVTEINYKVETVTDPLTGKTVRASTAEEGPENFQMTWGAVANLIKMHVGFAIPINRISLMIGQPEFSASKIYRILKNSAKDLLPVYLQLAEDLSDCGKFSGDDTATKILDLTEDKSGELSEKVEEHLRWKHSKANGDGDKKSLNVSLLEGKTEKDPRSTIRFFRTHLGSVGNLLTSLLEWRAPKSGDLIFQGDLSSTNLPSAAIQEKFKVLIAGCGAHARRPFWKFKEDDENYCFFMLRCFLFLSRLEKIIDAKGRTRANVLKYRGRYGKLAWQAIKNRSKAAIAGKFDSLSTLKHENDRLFHWPPSSDLNRASKYIINNFTELTLYLDNPELEFTNNGRERALRIEKCMLSSSKFRKTKEGRVILDILRTINATCTAANLDIADYLVYVSCHKHLLKSEPKLLTPYEVALALEQSKSNPNKNGPEQVNNLAK